MIISTVIPTRFKVLNYGHFLAGDEFLDKTKGNWKVVNNTYTLYSRNVPESTAQFLIEDVASHGYTKLNEAFAENKDIQVSNEGDRIRVVIPLERLFESGSAKINPNGLEWIKTLSSTISDFNFVEMRVEGHTDNVPVPKGAKGGFASNWELSSARASNIVQFLITRGVNPEKLAAVGYADARPATSNSTPEGKAKNRRIEFTIITSVKPEQAKAEPAPQATATAAP